VGWGEWGVGGEVLADRGFVEKVRAVNTGNRTGAGKVV